MQIVANTLLTFSIYALIGMGFYLLYRTHKFLNVGHGAMIAIGAYVTYALSLYAFGDSVWGLVGAMVCGAVGAGIVGLIFDLIFYRILRKKKRSSLMMLVASFGLLIIVECIISLLFTSQYHVVDTAESFAKLFHIAGASVTLIQIVSVIAAIVGLVCVLLLIKKTTFGRAVRAVSDDADVAVIVGIPVEKVLLGVSFLAAFLGGLAGGFVGIDTGILPLMGFAVFLKAVVGDIVGGLETYWGPILGALLVAILENVVVLLFGAEWRDVAVYVMLLVFLLFKPQGIIRAK